MPELPEVEIVCRGLTAVLEGRRIVGVDQRRPNLRFPFPEDFEQRLRGRTVVRLERRAKYVLGWLDDASVLVIHLGMTGRFSIQPSGRNAGEQIGSYTFEGEANGRHDHLVIETSDGTRVIYNDARRFGFMLLLAAEGLASHLLFRALGIEPLGPGFDAGWLAAQAAGRATDLKAFLMDQRIIAGLGNIYVCEALFRAGLSPVRKARTLAAASGKPSPGAIRLAPAIRDVLLDAISAGGSTLRDYRHADGTSGAFQKSHAVYGREGLPCVRNRCRGMVRRIIQAGRSSFYCPVCQR